MTGLEDARAYLNGARDGFTVHEVEVPEPNVVAIRGKTGLSQPAFAKSIVCRWEPSRIGSRAVGALKDQPECCLR